MTDDPAPAPRKAPEHPRRQARIGAALGMAFSVWAPNVVPFSVLTALVLLPQAALLYWALVTQSPFGEFTASMLQFFLITPLLTACVAFAVFQHLRGHPVTLGRCFRVGLGSLRRVAGVAALLSLIFAILLLPGAFLMLVDKALGVVVLLLGAIPALMVHFAWFVYAPVAVVERGSIGEILKRSALLTRGHRLAILGVVLILGILGGLVSVVLTLLASAALSDLNAEFWSSVLSELFLLPVQGSFVAVIYHELREAKEGIGIDELASVFE